MIANDVPIYFYREKHFFFRLLADHRNRRQNCSSISYDRKSIADVVSHLSTMIDDMVASPYAVLER